MSDNEETKQTKAAEADDKNDDGSTSRDTQKSGQDETVVATSPTAKDERQDRQPSHRDRPAAGINGFFASAHTWMALSAILLILFIVSLVTGGFSGGNGHGDHGHWHHHASFGMMPERAPFSAQDGSYGGAGYGTSGQEQGGSSRSSGGYAPSEQGQRAGNSSTRGSRNSTQNDRAPRPSQPGPDDNFSQAMPAPSSPPKAGSSSGGYRNTP